MPKKLDLKNIGSIFLLLICIGGYSQEKFKVDSIIGVIKQEHDAADFKRLQMNGNKAPEFKLLDINNNDTVTVSALSKKVILLEFCGYHCGPCRRAIPYLKEIEGRFKQSAFEFISIVNDAPKDTLLAFYKHKKLTNRYVIGSRGLDQQYSVFQLPVFFVIKNGIIINSYAGFEAGITDVAIGNLLDKVCE